MFEWFWPKEMRELAKRYREEGVLNEDAVNNFRRLAKKIIIIFVSLACIFYFADEKKLALFLLFITLLALKVDLYLIYRRQYAPYVHGRKIKGTVICAGTSIYGGAQRVYFEIEKGKKGIIYIASNPVLEKKDIPKPDDQIWVYHSDQHKFSMPDVDYLKSKYSLSKAIL